MSEFGVPDDVTVYAVRRRSVNNPSNCPMKPPEKGVWVWWRTGPHPQGVWLAMQTAGSVWGHAYQENQKQHPVFQDRALGDAGDWGHQVCHACEAMNEGYPEPRHATVCDGVCKRTTCALHSPAALKKKARGRALRRLAVAHPEELETYIAEELQ